MHVQWHGQPLITTTPFDFRKGLFLKSFSSSYGFLTVPAFLQKVIRKDFTMRR